MTTIAYSLLLTSVITTPATGIFFWTPWWNPPANRTIGRATTTDRTITEIPTSPSPIDHSPTTPLSDKCLRCICEHESDGCTPMNCRQDGIDGLMCGYFQMHVNYFVVC